MAKEYHDEMIEFMDVVKKKLEERFVDFIVIGIDITGIAGDIINVGMQNEESESNKERITRMIGEMEDLKFSLQLSSYGLQCIAGDEEDDELSEGPDQIP